MNRDDKIKLIKKHLGADDTWIIEQALKLLKDYDKANKSDRIKSLIKSMGVITKPVK